MYKRKVTELVRKGTEKNMTAAKNAAKNKRGNF